MQIEVSGKSRSRDYFFPFNRWLKPGRGGNLSGCRADIPLATPDTPGDTNYRIVAYTSDVKNAGSDADVFITLYGDNDDSGQHIFMDSTGKMLERGKVRGGSHIIAAAIRFRLTW